MKDGNTDRESITTWLQDVDGFQGLTKAYTFDDAGELAPEARILFFYEVQKGAWTVLGSSDDVVPA
jgi:hypothetical protein